MSGAEELRVRAEERIRCINAVVQRMHGTVTSTEASDYERGVLSGLIEARKAMDRLGPVTCPPDLTAERLDRIELAIAERAEGMVPRMHVGGAYEGEGSPAPATAAIVNAVVKRSRSRYDVRVTAGEPGSREVHVEITHKMERATPETCLVGSRWLCPDLGPCGVHVVCSREPHLDDHVEQWAFKRPDSDAGLWLSRAELSRLTKPVEPVPCEICGSTRHGGESTAKKPPPPPVNPGPPKNQGGRGWG